MFGSTVLDVAAGIIFDFLAIDLFTGATVDDQLGPRIQLGSDLVPFFGNVGRARLALFMGQRDRASTSQWR